MSVRLILHSIEEFSPPEGGGGIGCESDKRCRSYVPLWVVLSAEALRQRQ
jgi:hypothetical protein